MVLQDVVGYVLPSFHICRELNVKAGNVPHAILRQGDSIIIHPFIIGRHNYIFGKCKQRMTYVDNAL